MVIVSRYWAEYFILTTNGNKMYILNNIDDIKEQMQKKKTTIEVSLSTSYSTFILLKRNIKSYSKC